jgi:hypothetical protein
MKMLAILQVTMALTALQTIHILNINLVIHFIYFTHYLSPSQTLRMVESTSNLVRMSFALSNFTPSPATGGLDLSWPFMCVSIMFTKEAGRFGLQLCVDVCQ